MESQLNLKSVKSKTKTERLSLKLGVPLPVPVLVLVLVTQCSQRLCCTTSLLALWLCCRPMYFNLKFEFVGIDYIYMVYGIPYAYSHNIHNYHGI